MKPGSDIKRKQAAHRQKNHHTGIRAVDPLQLLQADVTLFKSLDNIKAYIYIVQDNFSRAILDYAVSLSCKAQTMMELISNVHDLKYRFLYHKHIPDYKSLCNYLPQAVEDYNSRSHAVLDGLTPTEVLNGKSIDKTSLSGEIKAAQQARLTANKAQQCCGYS